MNSRIEGIVEIESNKSILISDVALIIDINGPIFLGPTRSSNLGLAQTVE